LLLRALVNNNNNKAIAKKQYILQISDAVMSSMYLFLPWLLKIGTKDTWKQHFLHLCNFHDILT